VPVVDIVVSGLVAQRYELVLGAVVAQRDEAVQEEQVVSLANHVVEVDEVDN